MKFPDIPAIIFLFLSAAHLYAQDHQISGMLREKKSSWKIRDAAERARQARGTGAARWGGPATALMTRLMHAFMVGEDKA